MSEPSDEKVCAHHAIRVNYTETRCQALWPAVEPLLETIGSLTERIREYERQLETICQEHYPETELLRQVEGVGALTALTFVLTLEDPYRFEKSRAVFRPH